MFSVRLVGGGGEVIPVVGVDRDGVLGWGWEVVVLAADLDEVNPAHSSIITSSPAKADMTIFE